MIGDPPSLPGDHVQLSCPDDGLVGEETIGAAGTVGGTALKIETPLFVEIQM